MKCWNCQSNLEKDDFQDRITKKISFRAICTICGAWLHACKGCSNYKQGLPNDCKIPGTEYISDRTASNFCDEFVLLNGISQKSTNLEDVSKRLFGSSTDDEKKKTPKDHFNSLFDD